MAFQQSPLKFAIFFVMLFLITSDVQVNGGRQVPVMTRKLLLQQLLGPFDLTCATPCSINNCSDGWICSLCGSRGLCAIAY